MDEYIVSARKYRPSTFRSVVGQRALTATLKNAIVTNKLAHAYLFSGPRGVGKTTCARIFAKTINCFHPTEDHEACNACESCVAFNEQRSYNIHELDAASNNGVDDIRALIDQVRIPPQIGKYKVYIIDEVHMLSAAAFNSFLKTLEEPPHHAIFVLATTEKHKIIPTILSRCQVYDFSRISISDIVEHLQYVAAQEGVTTEPEALNVIAQKSDGGMRDALSIFDQTVSFTGGNITYKSVIESLNVLDYEYYFRLTDAILSANVVETLLILNDILSSGFEGQSIITGLAAHFRDLLMSKDAATAKLLEVGELLRARYIETAKKCDNQLLYNAIDLANTCDLNYRLSKNKRLLIELTFIKLCQLIDKPIALSEDSQSTIKPIAAVSSENKQQDTKQTPTAVAQSDTPAEVQEPEEKCADKETESTPKKATEESAKTEVPKTAESQSTEPQRAQTSAPTSIPKKKTHKKSVINLGVSISGMRASAASSEAASTESADKKFGNKPFTESQLIINWKSFAEELKEEVLLKNTMQWNLPKLISENEFQVEVNVVQSKYLADNSGAILSYLRKALRNDSVDMKIVVTKETPVKKATTPREIFDEMVERNPKLQKLSDEFDLELS